MIVKYADCVAVTCNGPDCERELYLGHVVPTEFEDDDEHYCDHCERPGCVECGVDLVGKARFEAHDIQPDGQTWFRCAKCSAAVIRDDLLHLLNLDRGDAVRQFAAECWLVKLNDSADYLHDDGRCPQGSCGALARCEDPNTSAA